MIGGIGDMFRQEREVPERQNNTASSTVKKRRLTPKKYRDPIRNEKCTACKKSLAKGYTIVTLKHKHEIRGGVGRDRSESSTGGGSDFKTCGSLACIVGTLIRQEQECYEELLETAKSELEEERTAREEK